MNRTWSYVVLLAGICFLFCQPVHAGDAGSHRIGGGVHYWRALDDIDVGDVDESGMAYMISYQYTPGAIILFEADLEVFPEKMTGTDEILYAPQVFVLVGGTIYAGLGGGYYYFDGDISDDPFFILRAGLNMELLPGIFIDLNANYHFSDLDGLKNVDDDLSSDTITLGAMLRFAL